ncbi:unnamed protein product (macronuclear) [Paramecium tetraurelia]|uniref:Uncharacterized protein n=1 Tax=Paramecium tetraurelia TaxID=5888 RepID=A0DNT2_PARTE|nr:uncharacterized protein GSPATT00018895001 [Paramecium tetraurelia]CAK84699.1 unnamed protein product [Paramecium tetraurelia]|eukprot:XP_001452096.1 hypothetical protein (macronuclear) [Paramecium tetraurelia strain d4-2]
MAALVRISTSKYVSQQLSLTKDNKCQAQSKLIGFLFQVKQPCVLSFVCRKVKPQIFNYFRIFQERQYPILIKIH